MGLFRGSSRPIATGRSACSAGCSPCSSYSWAHPPRSSEAGSSASGPGRPAWSPRSAGRRLFHLGAGRAPAPDLAPVARLGRHRRMRSRTGLHLAGLDAHQVVPRPTRDGDRHGDHGLWRRRHDRGTAGRPPDEALRDADIGRCLADLPHDGRHLLHAMLAGAIGYRVPPADWKPAGYVPATRATPGGMITSRNVTWTRRGRPPSSGSCGACSAST